MSNQKKAIAEGKSCPLPCVLRHLQCAKTVRSTYIGHATVPVNLSGILFLVVLALQTPPLRLANKPIVWVLGGPGSGKGTQCDKIVAKYGFVHLSSGDLLRDEVKSGSARGKNLNAIMKKGQLVSNDVVLDLLKEAIESRISKANGFLIDGYPREKSQGMQFERAIAPVTVILYFEASCDTLTKRILGRALTSGRSDDNEETIKLRMQTFLDNNQQVLDQYPGKLRRINAERSVDVIFADVKAILDPIMSRAHPAIVL